MSKRAPSDQPGSKRQRFASPSRLEQSNTDFLQDDVDNTGSSARAKDRRTLRDTSGYASDSTDDEESGVVPSRKSGSKNGGGDDDEDEDMFGGSGDDEKETKGSKAKAKEEFMNLRDIEGQDFAGARDEDDSEYDSEEEERKAKQGTGLDGPMAAELTAFNMKAELGEGRMTADGESYQTNDKDPHEQYDRWLEGTDKVAVRKARRAKREQERLEQERQQREADALAGGKDAKERQAGWMREMVELLQRGETVLEGLQRLGAEVERERKRKEGDAASLKKKSWAQRQRERRQVLETASDNGSVQVDQ